MVKIEGVTMQYGLAQAKAQLSYLTQLVDAGQEVLIARHGQPLYQLVSLQTKTPPAQKAALPESNGLVDWRERLAQTRAKTKPHEPEQGNFVAQWRQAERY
jgi:antitoxin (DNA-binding transcriptional repressor) of toxin-antitoxin stability system